MSGPLKEVAVTADRFEVTVEDAVLVAQLRSAIAICIYDAVEEAGALLHLRCIIRSSKPVDLTDTTLATELLLLDRCVQAMREVAPAARNLQARLFAHLDDHPRAAELCETVLSLVRHFLTDTQVRVLPKDDISGGATRELRFRPSMGWMQTR